MAPKPSKSWTRWTAIFILAVSGTVLLMSGFLVPVYFRAVDVQVLEETGRVGTTLMDEGIGLLRDGQMARADLFLQAAKILEMDGARDVEAILSQTREWRLEQGKVSDLDLILSRNEWARKWDGEAVTRIFSPAAARLAVRSHLSSSVKSGVLELVKATDLTELRFFSPALSAAGQPYETACLLSAYLVETGALTESMRNEVESLAFAATRKGTIQGLELVFLDLISLGNRMNWGQLVSLFAHVEGVADLHDLSNLIRHYGENWPLLVVAVLWEESSRSVARYLLGHAKTGRADILFGLRHGQEGLRHLLAGERRLYQPAWRRGLVGFDPFFSVFQTWLKVAKDARTWSMILKYGLLGVGAFFVGRAMIDLMPEAEGIRVKRWASPAHWSISGAVLTLTLLLCEPFLFQQAQTLNFPFHWNFPMVGEALRQTIREQLKPMIDLLTMVALVSFLVIQGIIYILCLLKLAEIRRQPVSSEVKLRLLENEENMFDSGLYCGLGGTVLSLVLLAMGIIKPSLMAAYASTLFGIIFVAVLKICHLRPFRRRLILDAES